MLFLVVEVFHNERKIDDEHDSNQVKKMKMMENGKTNFLLWSIIFSLPKLPVVISDNNERKYSFHWKILREME